MPIRPAEPDASWLSSYLVPSLVETRAFTLDTPQVRIKLDQNESPWDWPTDLKQRVAAKLVDLPWNRYPTAYADDLADLVADYVGVERGSVLLAPGSNYLVALLLSVFSKRLSGKVVVARPSFALYESHCRYDGIPYEPWVLNDDLEYDLGLLPELPDGSLVIFASPNNPVGNSLSKETFRELLRRHPRTLFLADEAYFEYSKEPYTDLLAEHSNFLSIRTFSKTLGSAGVRLGYVVGAKSYIDQIRKVRLPFMLNHFTLVAAHEILASPQARERLAQTVASAVQERQRVYEVLAAMADAKGFRVKPTEANFLLLRWPSDEAAGAVYEHLIRKGILVRDVRKGPGLKGCIRVTIGSTEENDALLAAFS